MRDELCNSCTNGITRGYSHGYGPYFLLVASENRYPVSYLLHPRWKFECASQKVSVLLHFLRNVTVTLHTPTVMMRGIANDCFQIRVVRVHYNMCKKWPYEESDMRQGAFHQLERVGATRRDHMMACGCQDFECVLVMNSLLSTLCQSTP